MFFGDGARSPSSRLKTSWDGRDGFTCLLECDFLLQEGV